MELTEEIREALKHAVERLGSQAEVARQSGLHEVYIGRYLSGRNQSLSDANAAKLMRFLRSLHLAVPLPEPGEVIANTAALRGCIERAMADRGLDYPPLARLANMKPDTLRRLLRGELATWFPGNLGRLLAELKIPLETAPLTPEERRLIHPALRDGGIPTRPCWVFTMAQAVTFEDVQEVIEPSSGWECAVIPIADGRDCIAFRVEGSSMEPKYYAGDVVICDKEAELVNGKPVVAKFGGRVVCKLFHRIGGTILLQSVHPEGQSYEVSPDDLDWCIRVIRFQREE